MHFFHNPILSLIKQGHEIIVTSRNKEMAVELLNKLNIEHIELSAIGKKGKLSLLTELVKRDYRLYHVARKFKPCDCVTT